MGAGGKIGTLLAKSIYKNYRLLLISSDAERLQTLQREILTLDAEAYAEIFICVTEACWEADIIILAVPAAVEHGVAEIIRPVVNRKLLISVSNPEESTADQGSAAEDLQALLPNAFVAKAFNTNAPSAFGGTDQGYRPNAFVAADRTEALNDLTELISCAGFNPILLGPLKQSRLLEKMHHNPAGITRQIIT